MAGEWKTESQVGGLKSKKIKRVVIICFVSVLVSHCLKNSDSQTTTGAPEKSPATVCAASQAPMLRLLDNATTASSSSTESSSDKLQTGALSLGALITGELRANLIAAGLAETQATAISNGAEKEMKTALSSLVVNTDLLTAVEPPIVRGSVLSLADPCADLSSMGQRSAMAKVIMDSAVGSLGGRTTGMDQGLAFNLIGTMVGGAVEKLSAAGLGGAETSFALDSVTSGAVGALAKAQIPQDMIGQAAQKVASGAVSALSQTGANQDQIGALAGTIAASAIQGLATAGLSADQIISSGAISNIVSGASSALTAAGISGSTSTTAIGAIAGAAVGAFAKAGLDSPSLRNSALANVVGGSMEGALSINPNSSSEIAAAMSSVASQAVAAMTSGGFAAEDVASASSVIVSSGMAKILEIGVGDAAAAIEISSKLMEGTMAGAATLAAAGTISAENVSSVASATSASAVQGLVTLQDAGVVKNASDVSSFNSSIAQGVASGLATGGSSAEVVASIQSSVDTTMAAGPIVVQPQAPVISDIANLTIDEDTNSGAVAFTISDSDSNLNCSSSLNFSSGNTSLLANNAVVFSGSAPHCTIQFSPETNASGTATLTVTVSDGALTAADSFILTVNAVNDTPSISDVSNQTINSNAATTALAITIEDIDSATTALTMSGSSSNTGLVPNSNIIFSGSGSSRSVIVTPASGQSGTATITLAVSDGHSSATDSFVLTVNAPFPPVISDIANITLNEDTSSGTVAFTISDVDSTLSCSSGLSFSSGNSAILTNGAVVFGGTAPNCTMQFSPVANANGSATMTVSVSDGALSTSDSFVLTVTAVDDAPSISDISNLTVNNGVATSALAVTVGDIDNTLGSLTMSGTSSNTALVPNGNISFGGSNANRTVTVTPVSGQSGSATITVVVSDGTLTANDTFVLSVNAPASPVISDIANLSINEDSNSGAVAFTITDADSSLNCSSSVSFSTGNTSLLANGAVVFTGTAPNCSMQFTPVTDANGTATMTVTVSDGTLSASDSFSLTVTAVNDGPTISDVSNQSVALNTATNALNITVGDIDNTTSSLTMSGSSSNTSLVPNGNIVFGGSNASRTVIVTPANGQSGSATITINVSDGNLTASDTFVLTVSADPTCPSDYVLVPANVALGTSSFCVMKYEAKSVGGIATSTSAQTPWISIARGANSTVASSAWKACKDLGANYNLISNVQWQAIARDIESVPANWSNGDSSGSNALNQGLNGGALAASTDGDPCNGTGVSECADNTHADFSLKRTHTLSNSGVIWDIAGNVWEWVQDDNTTNQGSSDYVSQLTSSNYNMLKWGPVGDYTAKNSGSYGGLGYATMGTSGAVLRGGDFGGVFSAYLTINSSFTAANTGFRCVMNASSGLSIAPTSLPAAAVVLDADSVQGTDGSAVTSWTDATHNIVATTYNAAPTLSLAAINGHNAIAFNGASSQALQVDAASTPTSLSTAFTVALVFMPTASGVGATSQWYGNTGLVDAEQGGVTKDWGISLDAANKVGAGIGQSDYTHYSSAISTSATHYLIYSWRADTGVMTLTVDGTTSTYTSSATAARNSYRFLIGSLAGQGGRYFSGKIAHLRIYSSALSTTDKNDLGAWLAATYGI